MTKARSRTWWRIVREVADEVERRRDGELPWKPEYAPTFPDPQSLLEALRYLWQLEVVARVEEPTLQQLGDDHRGLLMTLLGPTGKPPDPHHSPERGTR